MHRSLRLSFAPILALGVVYGCGSDDGAETTPDPEPSETHEAFDASPLTDANLDGGPGATTDAGADARGDATSDAGPKPYVDYDINHVLVTGQSNAVSNSGTPVLSTTQPYENLMFDTGVMPMRGRPGAPTGFCNGAGCTAYETPASFVPLVEGDRFFNYAVETSAAGLANEVSHLATTRHGRPKHDVLVSNHGRSGNTYWCLRKPVPAINGSTTNSECNYKTGYLSPFLQGMMEVESGKALAAAAGKSYVVRAVATIHGESDDYSYANPQSGGWEFPLDAHDGTPNAIKDYADALVEWQRDYETSIRAITGQTAPVPLLVSQISGWNHGTTSKVAQNQLDAHVAAPGKVVLVGPSYPLALDQGDCLHFTSAGVRHLGEYFAKVYARIVFGGETWEPVRPKSVTRTNEIITVKFHVPRPPLVIDETLVAAAASRGFTYVDGSGGAAPTITNVAITAPDTVRITLSAAPTAAGRRLRYAMNQVKNTCIGTPNGARGNLRDSDADASRSGSPLYNWAVHFDVAVP